MIFSIDSIQIPQNLADYWISFYCFWLLYWESFWVVEYIFFGSTEFRNCLTIMNCQNSRAPLICYPPLKDYYPSMPNLKGLANSCFRWKVYAISTILSWPGGTIQLLCLWVCMYECVYYIYYIYIYNYMYTHICPYINAYVKLTI